MKQFELESKMKSFEGKVISYAGKTGKYLGYQEKDNVIKIHLSNQNPIVLLKDGVKKDIEQILIQEDAKAGFEKPTEEKVYPAEQKKQSPALRTEEYAVGYRSSLDNSVFTQLRATLMNNIEKVQADPSYIPQAEAVRDNVGSVIDLAKTEIEYVKMLDKLNK